jgi:hypothetical protein
LWGREQGEALRRVLRRRRFDWNWHARGLDRTLAVVRPALAPSARLVTLVAEAEPGFTAAALAGGARAGFALSSFALRADTAEAQAEWQPDLPSAGAAARESAVAAQQALNSMVAALRARAEPSRWATLHAAAWSDLVRAGPPPAEGDDVLGPFNRALESAARDGGALVRLGAESGDDPATGLWWLAPAALASAPAGTPLSDRVEADVLVHLAPGTPVDERDLLPALYAAFPGPATPGRGLVLACLNACGRRLEAGVWQLRPEDAPAARAADQAAILAHLRALGVRHGYEVDDANPQAWREHSQPVYVFEVLTSASISAYVLGRPPTAARRRFLVLPGGRAGLAEFKLRRDPRLRPALATGHWSIVKYRHVRRMAADAQLTRATLEPALGGDPLEAAQQLALPG